MNSKLRPDRETPRHKGTKAQRKAADQTFLNRRLSLCLGVLVFRNTVSNSLSTFPLECTLLPNVDVAGKHGQDEHEHFEKPEKFQVPINHGPRKQKNGLNVEE